MLSYRPLERDDMDRVVPRTDQALKRCCTP
jgi:hypothetical protein